MAFNPSNNVNRNNAHRVPSERHPRTRSKGTAKASAQVSQTPVKGQPVIRLSIGVGRKTAKASKTSAAATRTAGTVSGAEPSRDASR